MIRSWCVFGGFASWALASLLGCSIDDRRLTTGVGSLSEGGTSGMGSGGNGGTGAAALTVVPSVLDLGAVTQGFAARGRIRLSNPGNAPLSTPAVAWADGGDPDLTVVLNQCGNRLGPLEQCDLRVQVIPSRTGGVQGTLQLSPPNADMLSVPVTATGLQPGPIIIQPAVGSFSDFGSVLVGAAAQGAFTVTNPGGTSTGPVDFAFNRPEFALAPPAPGDCVPGTTDLAGGASCDVRLSFTPTERGSLEATLSVTTPDAGNRSLTLRGRGLVPAALGVSASTLDFGGVVPGDTASMDVEVTNDGDESLTLASAQLTPPDSSVFRIADSNCGEGVVLAPAQRCRLQLDYRPVAEGTPSAGELLIAAQAGGPSQTIPLQGTALTRGNLLVEAVTSGEENFGDVLLGESLSRTFRISNPTQQASGALRLSTRNGFELEPPSGSDACQVDVTELANGQSCTVAVRFAPTLRGAKAGAITVDSPLAGAKSLALSARGISPGVLEADTGNDDASVDFGRVTTGSSASRTITVRNAGDQPLAPPVLSVAGGSDAQSAAFAFENGCSAELASDGVCQIALRFSPTSVVPYAASLELVPAAGDRASVLLLGEALEPGRLTLTGSEGASPDFGDVAVGGSIARSFTVTNPGGGASGALSVRTDDSQFVVQPGACNEAGADGLADGETCSFDVTFTPTTNAAVEARLSVQAASSGETGIALTGRGRLPAALAATTTERDLGRANLGQASGPANQFTWTVNNGGDVASGPAGVTNSNPDDFDIIENTCMGTAVPGGGSCSLTIAFAPDSAGDRTTRITVDDAASGQSVPLTVTGFGVQLAAPGEACVATADCMSGVCTGGLCCDQDCNLTCQSCATGQCVALSGQEPCGNAGGVCFGLEQCALPAGGGCTDDSQCGGGLVCKDCLAGGRQCTAPDACCGGCSAGYTCIEGECGCSPQADGRPRLDCGGGLCALNRSGACCPGSPPADCNCDPSDNLCKECLTASDCTDGLIGGTASCTPNRTCSYGCAGTTKECNGACIPNTQCCNCGAGQECNTNTGQCVISFGGACGAGTPACESGGVCVGGRCCAQGCNNGCFPDGTCSCGPGEEFARGDCRPSSGASCETNADCAGTCVFFYVDADGDGFGDPTQQVGFCGSPPVGASVVADIRQPDCCDGSNLVKPSQDGLSDTIVVDPGVCPRTWKPMDLNCDGKVTYEAHAISEWQGTCSDVDLNPGLEDKSCEERGGVSEFQANLFMLGPVIDPGTDDALLCGNSSIQYIVCRNIGGVCTGNPQLAPRCH